VINTDSDEVIESDFNYLSTQSTLLPPIPCHAFYTISNIPYVTKAITMQEINYPRRDPALYSRSNRNASTSSSVTAVHHADVESFDVEADMAEAVMQHDSNARPEHFTSTFEECVFVFTVVMASASTTFLQGVTVINTATIGKDLRMTAAEVTWISAALGYAFPDPVAS
jgi:hypothetical protein